MVSQRRINNLIKAIDNNIFTKRFLNIAVELIDESKDIPLPVRLSETTIRVYISLCAPSVSPRLLNLKPHLSI